MDPISLMVVGRIVERGLIAAGGLLALWFGFRLFALISTERSNAKLSGHGFTFQAERIGPGVFFALFGAILLGYSLLSQVTITSDIDLREVMEQPGNPSNAEGIRLKKITIAGFGEVQEDQVPASLKAVNTLINIAERQTAGSTELTGTDYQRFMRAVPALQAFQRTYVDTRFEAGTFDVTVAMQKQCAENTENCQAFLQNQSSADRYSNVLDLLGEMIN